jgi:hypothetical protein
MSSVTYSLELHDRSAPGGSRQVTILPLVMMIRNAGGGHPGPYAGFLTVSPVPSNPNESEFAVRFTPLTDVAFAPSDKELKQLETSAAGLLGVSYAVPLLRQERFVFDFFGRIQIPFDDFLYELRDPSFVDVLGEMMEQAIFGRSAEFNPKKKKKKAKWSDQAVGATGDALVQSVLYRLPGLGIMGLGIALVSPAAMLLGAAVATVGSVWGLYAGGRDHLEEFFEMDIALDRTEDIEELASKMARRSTMWAVPGGWLTGNVLGLLPQPAGAIVGGVGSVLSKYGFYYSAMKGYLEDLEEDLG